MIIIEFAPLLKRHIIMRFIVVVVTNHSGPLLFGTTEEFLRTFGVKSLGDLPTLNSEQMEDFRKQAEEEAGVKVEI